MGILISLGFAMMLFFATVFFMFYLVNYALISFCIPRTEIFFRSGFSFLSSLVLVLWVIFDNTGNFERTQFLWLGVLAGCSFGALRLKNSLDRVDKQTPVLYIAILLQLIFYCILGFILMALSYYLLQNIWGF